MSQTLTYIPWSCLAVVIYSGKNVNTAAQLKVGAYSIYRFEKRGNRLITNVFISKWTIGGELKVS